MKKVIDLQAARKAADHRKYKETVLDAYDKIDRLVTREKKENVAEVRRKARNTL